MTGKKSQKATRKAKQRPPGNKAATNPAGATALPAHESRDPRSEEVQEAAMMIGFDLASEEQQGASVERLSYLRDLLRPASEEDFLAVARLDYGPEWPTLSRTSNANETISTEDFVTFLKRHCDREKVPRNSALWRAIDLRQHLDLIQSINSLNLPMTINGVYKYARQQKIPMRNPEWAIHDLHSERAIDMPPTRRVPIGEVRAEALLLAIVDAGYDPTNLPTVRRGTPGVKSELKQLLLKHQPGLFTRDTFDDAWQELRNAKKIIHEER